MSRCVATQRGKQTSGTSLEAMCDRASIGKQPELLLGAGMMSYKWEQQLVVKVT